MKIIAVILAILLIISLSVGGWLISRKVNYSLSYKSMVEDTIREMVKEEALKRR